MRIVAIAGTAVGRSATRIPPARLSLERRQGSRAG